MSIERLLLPALCVAVLWGCSGDEMSLTQYIERTNVIAERAGRQGEALIAEGEAVADFTPQHVEALVERGLTEIRIPLQEAADAIDPPERVADLHHLLWDWHAELMAIEETLAVWAGSVDASWIPGEMEEAVEAVLGCSWYPDNPDDAYRYPPTTTAS